ncbi:MAG: kelch repeat-containing protein [bacterium]
MMGIWKKRSIKWICLIVALLLLASVVPWGIQASSAKQIPDQPADQNAGRNTGSSVNWTLNLSSEGTSTQLSGAIKAGDTLTLSCRLYGPDTQVKNPWRHEEGYQLWSDERSWEVLGSRFLAYPDFLYSLEGAPDEGKGEMPVIGEDPTLAILPADPDLLPVQRPDYGGLLEIELRARVNSPSGLLLTTESSSQMELDMGISSRMNRSVGLALASSRTLLEVGEPDPALQTLLDLNATLKPPARVGTFKPLVVMVDFPDNTASASSIRSFYQNLLFATSGISMTTFFLENSWNQLNLQGNVVWNHAGTAWVRTTTTYAWYVNNQTGTGAYPQNSQRLTEDILDLIDPYVNFSDYDGNGDGEIDGLMVIYAGPAGGSTRIWPHKWGINPQVRDGIQISTYCMQQEYNSNPLDTDISVYCHEYGHVLGAYDLYDYNYTSAGVGRWSLMAFDNKQHFDPWSKSLLGWITPTVRSSNAAALLVPAVETTKLVYRLNLGDPTEYYLVENRANLGYDQNLPGWGLLIWHIDEDAASGHINSNEWHPPDHLESGHCTVAVEQADSLYELEKGINGGNAGDPFATSSSFTPITNPSSCDYQGLNWNIQITNISTPGASIYADFSFNLNNRVITWWPLRTGNLSFLLQGSANPNSQSTQAWFEWGTTTAYGNSTSPIALGSGTTSQRFAATFSTPAIITNYHYRAVCQNASGTFIGEDRLLLPSGTWTKRNPTNLPPARNSHAMAYDSQSGKLILFGGWGDGGKLNDTWTYDYATNTWTNRNPSNSPPARDFHTLVYDNQSKKTVLFGGRTDSGYLNDTWAYDEVTNAWTNRNPTNPPPPRNSHAMVYDSQNGKVILFGGLDDYGNLLNDTWAYDYISNTWTNRNPTNPPLVRMDDAIAYDSQSNKVILFGGWGNSGKLSDTWAYNYATNTWTNRNSTNPPPARDGHTMAYDNQSGKLILFGGWGDSGKLNDTWAYDYTANTWVNRNPTDSPLVCAFHAIAYDSQSNKLIVFGGWGNSGKLSDTWAYNYATNVWTNRNPTNPPPARARHAIAYDSQSGKLILFGGLDDYGNLLNDTWAYDYISNTWTNRNPINSPPARDFHAITYDSQSNEMILFGGWGNSGRLNDTWAYNYATNTWTNRNSTNPPPPRNSHAMVYDSKSGKVIFFGGLADYGNLLNDTWAYDYISNTWTNRNPTNPPPTRNRHVMVYDSQSEKAFLFGGMDDYGNLLNDSWAYDFATNTWTNLNAISSPQVRIDSAMAYDGNSGKAILFGGWGNSGWLNDTWAFHYSSNTWTNRNPANPPLARNSHAIAFDGHYNKAVLFGGWNGKGLNDTWAYDYGEENSIPSLSLVSPNGGQNWAVGTSHHITWTSANLTGNIKLELSRNGGSTYPETLAASLPVSAGSFNWTVTGPTSTTCRVKITSLATPSLFAASNSNITISAPTSTATLYFQPSAKNTGTGAFSWELYLSGATGMKQFEFHLSFDKAYLNGVSFTPNAFFTQVAQNAFNNTTGIYDFAGASPSAYSGSWPMLVGTFQWNALQATGANGTLVHFTSVLAQDASFNPIAVTPQDGTVVITTGGWALGTIGLESRPQSAWSGIRVVVDDNPTLSATTGANGSYRIDGISPGSHTLKAYRAAFLAGTVGFSIQTGQGTTVSGRLRGGDGNDDGSVNLTDLGLLANNFNLSAPQPFLSLSSSAQSETTTTEDSPSSSSPSPSIETAATLYFQPSAKNTGTGAFSWELYLSGATGMKQFEFHLSFDKAYLNGVSFTPNAFFTQVAQNAFNNTTGIYDFAGASPSAYGGSWPMLVGTFQWNLLQSPPGGETVVSFTSVLAQDADFQPIPINPQNGTVQSQSILSLSYALSAGWNMIAVPLALTNPNPEAVFPTGWPLYLWDAVQGNYRSRSQITLALRDGYWLKVPSAQPLTISGQGNSQANTEIPLSPGWNLIGTPYQQPVPWASVSVKKGAESKNLEDAMTSGWIKGPFYGWTGTSYQTVAVGGSFQPTSGYWIKDFLAGCSLVFGSPF